MVITGSRKMNRSSEKWASQVVPGVKTPPANAGDIRDAGSIPGLGRSPEEGIGYLLQYSGLENSMNSIVCGVAESDTTE